MGEAGGELGGWRSVWEDMGGRREGLGLVMASKRWTAMSAGVSRSADAELEEK